MSSSLLKARNVYTGPSIHKLTNEEFEQLVSSDHGDSSYITWEKKYLQRKFHPKQESTDKTQKRFTEFAQHMHDDKPLLVLDIDNTLIFVRYFSDEMEIGDTVTFFNDKECVSNDNNARVIALQQTLILKLTDSELIDIHHSEIIEYSNWIYNNNNRNNVNDIFDYNCNNKTYKCKIFKILMNGCKIEMINKPNDIITIDFTSNNEKLCKLEPCLKRNNMKEVDFVYEGFLVRMRPCLEDFIEEMMDSFHICLYTSAVESIYSGIVSRMNEILKDIYGRNDEKDLQLWYSVLFRDDCILKYKNNKPYHYKDLSLFGKHLSRVIMIDNSPSVLRGQEPNVLLIADYLGVENIEKEDEELYSICDILSEIKYKYHKDLRYYLCDLNFVQNINKLQQLYDINNEISCFNTTERFINTLKNNYKNGMSDASTQINRQRYRSRSRSRRKSSSCYQSIRLSPKSMTPNCNSNLQTISEFELNMFSATDTNSINGSNEVITIKTYPEPVVADGLFGNSNIRQLYNNISLFIYCIFSFGIYFDEFVSLINILGIIILSIASVMGLSHNIFKLYYSTTYNNNLCLEKWTVSIVYCFYMGGCLFYFLGGCLIALYYTQKKESYFGVILFIEHTFIAAHSAINSIDLYNKSYLNEKKYRIIVYNIIFLFLTIIASFSYVITSIYMNDNIGFVFVGIFYFCIQIPIIMYLLIYFEIFSLFHQNNIMLLVVGGYLFCLICLFNGYLILMIQFKQFKGRIYFIGIGLFILLNGGIIACDMFLDKIIEYGGNINNIHKNNKQNLNEPDTPISGQTDILNASEKEEFIDNL